MGVIQLTVSVHYLCARFPTESVLFATTRYIFIFSSCIKCFLAQEGRYSFEMVSFRVYQWRLREL
jgi:hypothetical protein